MSTREHDLALLAAGEMTGWWDQHGVPAPWPEDFFDPNSGWQPAGGETTTEPGQPPF
jgi:hypothetical protein